MVSETIDKQESPPSRPRVTDNGLEQYFLGDRSGHGGLFCARYEIDESNTITEYDIEQISTDRVFRGGSAGGAKQHAIDYLQDGPEGTEGVIVD